MPCLGEVWSDEDEENVIEEEETEKDGQGLQGTQTKDSEEVQAECDPHCILQSFNPFRLNAFSTTCLTDIRISLNIQSGQKQAPRSGL